MRDSIRRWQIPKLYFELGIIALGCLVLAFFMFGARGDETTDDELKKLASLRKPKSKPRLVQNGNSKLK